MIPNPEDVPRFVAFVSCIVAIIATITFYLGARTKR